MSKKPKLVKGKPQSLQELTIDAGRQIATGAVEPKGDDILSTALRFIQSPTGQKLLDAGIQLIMGQLGVLGQPDPRRVQAVTKTGIKEGAVVPRSDAHEHLFKILNGIPEEQIRQVMPMIENLMSPGGMAEIMKTILDPEKLQAMIQDIAKGG